MKIKPLLIGKQWSQKGNDPWTFLMIQPINPNYNRLNKLNNKGF